MKFKIKSALFLAIGVSIALLSIAACQGASDPSNATSEVPSGKTPNASINGAITYRERLNLSPGASVVMELRDVSYADASAPLIARQTISDPGQVPIKFKVEYSREHIDPRNTYGISARIIESDGRLAFINDTAYDVITHGNPDRVDMLLVLVKPPPDLVDDADADWQTWVEVPVTVISANLIPNEVEHFLRVAYYRSTIEGCARPGSQSLRLDGNDIIVGVTLMQPPPTAWSIPCHEQVVELDTVELVGSTLKSGKPYRVIVNGRVTTTFTLPDPGLGHTLITESPIESWEMDVLESSPPQYQLRVVSGMPTGSSCSQFNGFEIRRIEPQRLEVLITHHVVADSSARCTKDYPIVETVIPLGSDFDSGMEYAVSVNAESDMTFTAQ